jgi:hypothetical protein
MAEHCNTLPGTKADVGKSQGAFGLPAAGAAGEEIRTATATDGIVDQRSPASSHLAHVAIVNSCAASVRGDTPAGQLPSMGIKACCANQLPRANPAMESTLPNYRNMPSREFEDAGGVIWRVWSTVPVSGAVINNPGFEKGWLTFESESGALRRLAPVPPAWETLPAERLELLLRTAAAVPRHTGPIRRVSDPRHRDSR